MSRVKTQSDSESVEVNLCFGNHVQVRAERTAKKPEKKFGRGSNKEAPAGQLPFGTTRNTGNEGTRAISRAIATGVMLKFSNKEARVPLGNIAD